MTTTTVIGGLGLGGLGAAAVGAATVGLGVAALSGLFRGRNNRRSGRRRGGYRRRYYRQVAGKEEEEGDRESEVLQRVLDLIRQQDVIGCGMKLMCELAGISQEELDEDQMAILNLVEPITKPGEGVLPPGGAGDYATAKIKGQTQGNCSVNYPLCPLNGDQLMQLIDSYVP